MIYAAINTRHSSLGTLRGKRGDATGKAQVGVVEIQPWQGDGMWVRRKTHKGEGTIGVASTQTLDRGLWLSGLSLMWVTEYNHATLMVACPEVSHTTGYR